MDADQVEQRLRDAVFQAFYDHSVEQAKRDVEQAGQKTKHPAPHYATVSTLSELLAFVRARAKVETIQAAFSSASMPRMFDEAQAELDRLMKEHTP